MPTFTIYIHQMVTHGASVDVEAESLEEAIGKAEDKFGAGEIELEAEGGDHGSPRYDLTYIDGEEPED